MQYRFTMVYGQEDFISFMTAYMARGARNVRLGRLLRILSRVFGALMVITAAANMVLFVYTGAAGFGQWLMAAIVLLAGLFIFYSKDAARSGRVLWKRYDKKGKSISFLFGPNGYRLHDVSGDTRFEYSGIKDIVEDEGHYYLFFSRSEGHILLKSGADKDAGGFRSFIEEKTGLTVLKAF